MNGWTAYVLDGNLFLKKFTDQPASAQPTGEGEIDVYPGAGFLEFEVQGPYTQIAVRRAASPGRSTGRSSKFRPP